MSSEKIPQVLRRLGIKAAQQGTGTGVRWIRSSGRAVKSVSPVDGKFIGSVSSTDQKSFNKVMDAAGKAFLTWRLVPAPRRGEIVRQIGEALRRKKEDLGALVSYEMGKSLQEGLGEVQEMIDICDYAVGLSRQLHGLTMHSERPSHRMFEQWHPLGVVGIITAFNFPVAVWSWNTMIAWVCGNTCIWKPSEKTPLCSIACQHIVAEVFRNNDIPEGVSCVVNGDYRVGEWLASNAFIPLISATGSTRMGIAVASTVAGRLGRTLLELGGNNAIIVSEKADLDMTVRGALFGAVGTAGQRCTTTRRLIIHESVFEQVKLRLV